MRTNIIILRNAWYSAEAAVTLLFYILALFYYDAL